MTEALTERQRWVRRLTGNGAVMTGAAILLVLVAAALLANMVSTHNPTRLVPANRLQPPSAEHYPGTDEFGRDVYSLVLHGSRVSLLVGLTTMLLTSAGGIVIGLTAGYSRKLDVPVMRCMDGLMAFPAILLAIALMAARGPGVWNVIVALSVVYMPRTAMLIRSTVLSLATASTPRRRPPVATPAPNLPQRDPARVPRREVGVDARRLRGQDGGMA